MKNKAYIYILLSFLFLLNTVFAKEPITTKDKLIGSRVLVYTKNGTGYIHDNIASAVLCIQQLGEKHHFKVDVSDDPTIFNQANLKKYQVLIFTSTNNDVFDNDDQRVAFRRYIEAGGGFDFFLPFFKFAVEFKTSIGLPDLLIHEETKYALPIEKLRSRAFVVSITFEG